jgi:hypothetical protein
MRVRDSGEIGGKHVADKSVRLDCWLRENNIVDLVVLCVIIVSHGEGVGVNKKEEGRN